MLEGFIAQSGQDGFLCIGGCRDFGGRCSRYTRYRGRIVSKFFGFVEAALDQGRGYVEVVGDGADGFSGCVEVGHLFNLVGDDERVFRCFGDLLGFGGDLYEFEVGVGVGLGDFVDEDGGGIVVFLPCPVFYLFDVAVVFIFGAEADGNGTVEEVDELSASGEVVLGDGLVAVDFWGVGQDDDGEAKGFFEFNEAFHEFGGGGGFFGVTGDEGDVVDEDFADADGGGFFDALEDGLVEVVAVDVFGVDFGPVELRGKDVAGAGLRVGVAELKLFVGEFAVDVEHRFAAGDIFGHLGGENGFAGVGDGEEDRVFIFDDEVVTIETGIGPGQ